MKKLRGTGRTTRLINDAIKQAVSGKAVYVLSCTEKQAWSLEKMAGSAGVGLGIKFESIESIGGGFCWDNLRVLGSHPNCVFLVDHHVIEQKFETVLNMLHKYDKE